METGRLKQSVLICYRIEFITTEEVNVEEERQRLNVQLKRIVTEKLKHLEKIKRLSAVSAFLLQYSRKGNYYYYCSYYTDLNIIVARI